MARPQFTIRALLVAMLVVAAFFGGMAWQRGQDQRKKKVTTPHAMFQKDFTTPGAQSKLFSTKTKVDGR